MHTLVNGNLAATQSYHGYDVSLCGEIGDTARGLPSGRDAVERREDMLA